MAVDQADAGSGGARGKIQLLRWAIVLAAVLSLGFLPPVRSAVDPPNPIVVENQRPGTDSWQLGRAGFRISNDANGQIKGYASATSVNRGESIDFQVSVNPAQDFTADFYRMGWYGGLGARHMAHVGPLAGRTQRTCRPDSTTGLVDCAWSATFGYSIPDSWTSGIYLVQLTNARKYQAT